MKLTALWFLVLAGAVLCGVYSPGQAPAQPPEALTGFDDRSNGFSDPDRRRLGGFYRAKQDPGT